MVGESLLVNFVYCHPVGHAVEPLQYCLGYRRADPSRRIGLVLKANTAVKLAKWCSFVDEIYTVDLDVVTAPQGNVLDHVPHEWDWVVDDPRGINSGSTTGFLAWPAITGWLGSGEEPGEMAR